ncbi:MAG: hypothetical protein KDH18_10900 [Rhodoferax sp.]|nr:hypothetical protein [Rhodoferax sp.]
MCQFKVTDDQRRPATCNPGQQPGIVTDADQAQPMGQKRVGPVGSRRTTPVGINQKNVYASIVARVRCHHQPDGIATSLAQNEERMHPRRQRRAACVVRGRQFGP